MSSSTATSITQPDAFTSAPRAGAFYSQIQTLGVTVQHPTGTAVTLGPENFQGGPFFLRQGTSDSGVGGGRSTMPIGSMQLVQELFQFSSPTAIIPAPDPLSTGTGHTSFRNINPQVADLDWIGSIDVPKANGGLSPFGTVCVLVNRAGGGNQLNIIDASAGGTMRVGGPSVTIGFLEWAAFMYDQFGWSLIGVGGGYQFNGANVGDPRSRVISTTTSTPKRLIGFATGAATTPGIAFRFDVAAEKNDALGTTLAYWIGGMLAFDGANNMLTFSKGTVVGTNGGAPPVGWDINFFTNVGGFNGLDAIGDNVNNIRWRIKYYMIAAPS